MNFFKPKEQSSSPNQPPLPPPSPQFFLHQAFTAIQTHVSNFLQNHRHPPTTAPWARIPIGNNNSLSKFNNTKSAGKSKTSGAAMSIQDIEERLAGVPVYALSNADQEFVLISGANTEKSLGMFCFSEADAASLLQQMKSMDPNMRNGSQVVAVALNKVFQLKVDGVAFRLIPEPSQVKNALKTRKKAGIAEESLSGVPVFQSKSLTLRSQSKRYRPVFFRKEDLERSLTRASHDQKLLNPALREGDIQVAVLEDIIQAMKDSSTSQWDDIVFIPPGFDVSTAPSQQ